MQELTTLHASSRTTKHANKRGKNTQADAVPNSNYGLNGAGARNGASAPYDPPPPDPYPNGPGAPGWQLHVGHATYVNPSGYHTQYVEGRYAAFPLTEVFPSTPTYSHHHPHIILAILRRPTSRLYAVLSSSNDAGVRIPVSCGSSETF